MLQPCLRSIYANTATEFEIIVVDNGSEDGTVEMVQAEFPAIRLIRNDHNTGFARPTNQALRLSRGEYVLLLNPDAVVLPGALDHLVEFMQAHPEAGICGPKVLNSDGTVQKQCHRSFATPWDLVCYFSGLMALFPKSRLFGRYLMTYLDEQVVNEVDVVSGACLLARRALLDGIGLLDEQFFAYHEETDFCFRAKRAGWRVFYTPAAQIMHYGGRGGSRVDPYRSIVEWHRSYYRYYRKDLAARYPLPMNLLVYAAMIVKLAGALVINLFRREKFAGSRKP